jgi:hypothetical protein
MATRLGNLARAAAPLALVALAAGAGRAQDVWGTAAGEAMMHVSVQFTEERDNRLWHLPVESVAVHSPTALRAKLRGGPTVYLPVSAAGASELADLVTSSQGQLVRLEFHPAREAPRGMVHAAWTHSSRRGVIGEGNVPYTGEVYSAMLRYVGEKVPNQGIFAPIAAAQRRLDLLVQNVTASNGREVDELVEDFRAAAENAGVPMEFYRLPEGRASDESIRRLVNRGYELSAVDYWNSAISKFRQNRIVSPTLNDFESSWSLVSPDTRVQVEFPGTRGKRTLNESLLHEFRRIAGQKYLDAAASAARAEDPDWTVEMLRRFAEERAASGLPMSDFEVDGRPGLDTDMELLVKRARRETGFAGFFRAIWHKVLEASMPNATPT